MAALLYRLGAWTCRCRRTVLVAWLALLLAAAVGGTYEDDFSIPGSRPADPGHRRREVRSRIGRLRAGGVRRASRMHEDYAHSRDPQRAIATGFRASARVVAAAALIMVAVFASFIPDGDATLKPIAFALTVGVLLDAFLIRMTLVPAVLALTRHRAWWLPRWLDRVLPNLDVEGAQLSVLMVK